MPPKQQAKNYIKAGLLTLSAAALLASCHRLPDGVMDEKELSSLLADMQIAEAYYMVEGMPSSQRAGMVDADSVKKAVRQQILTRHGVTQKDFETTLDWYGHNIDRYEDVCDLTLEKLNEKSRKYASAKSPEAEAKDAKGLWPSSLFLSMGGHTGRSQIAFTLKGSQIKKGERLLWNFNTTSLTSPLNAVIAVDYTDGSTSLISQQIMSEGRQSIALQTDSTLTPALAYGYLSLTPPTTASPSIPPTNSPAFSSTNAPAIPPTNSRAIPPTNAPTKLLLLDSISLQTEPTTPSKYYGLYRQKYLPAPKKSPKKSPKPPKKTP